MIALLELSFWQRLLLALGISALISFASGCTTIPFPGWAVWPLPLRFC